MYLNPKLDKLVSYPFERLNKLLADISPSERLSHIPLSIGEPKHEPPQIVIDLLADQTKMKKLLSSYPSTKGSAELRQTISLWFETRFGTNLNPENEILPVNGTREALFSFAQSLLSGHSGSRVVMPNPFYQIYEGATLLAGASPYFCSSFEKDNYQQDFDSIEPAIWKDTELVYLCSPANPTGKSLSDQELEKIITLAHRHNFLIASDECYSEIYLDENKQPNSLLAVSEKMGNKAYERCVAFHSLSKRSNLPGLRSGFVAGDKKLLDQYFLYRTYHGCAMSGLTQEMSAIAWGDEGHVLKNRELYKEKFSLVENILGDSYPIYRPDGGFYHWIKTPVEDQEFSASLMEKFNVKVMPGSFLSREQNGDNPGANHVRVAWVSSVAECQRAATRLVEYVGHL